MESFLAAGGTDENWCFPGCSKQFSVQVRTDDTAQPPRPQLDLLESLAIGLQRRVVVNASGHVTEVRWRDSAARGFLEIHHVERIFWVGQDAGLLRLPGPRRQRRQRTAG